MAERLLWEQEAEGSNPFAPIFSKGRLTTFPTMTTNDTTFATALNCMDGRVQLPVNEAVRSIFDVTCVDTITEAGIVNFLSDETDAPETQVALANIQISLDKHGSKGIAIAAHDDCAGNPQSEQMQKEQLQRAVSFLRSHFPTTKIVGLWLGLDWKVQTVVSTPSA